MMKSASGVPAGIGVSLPAMRLAICPSGTTADFHSFDTGNIVTVFGIFRGEKLTAM